MTSLQLAYGTPWPGDLANAAVRAWPGDLVPACALASLALLYAAGATRAWSVAGVGRGISVARAVAFPVGLAAIAAAVLTPLESLAALFFSAHMAQHLLLVFVAAPLLVLGTPLLALLWLAPLRARRAIVRAVRGSAAAARAWDVLAGPAASWAVFVAVLWAWHLPAAYEAALASEFVHGLEHATLLAAACLFWWLLLSPMGRRRLGSFAALPLLFLTALQGGVLGAMITLSPRPWYSHYERVAAAAGFSALSDQQLAGLLMWVPPSLVWLGLACWKLHAALGGPEAARGRRSGASRLAGTRSLWGLLVAVVVFAQQGEAQVLRPAGPAAQRVSELWWTMLVIAVVVCAVVYALLFLAVFRPRRHDAGPPLGDAPFVVLGGIVVPLAILVPLLFYTVGVTAAVARPAEDAVTIEVIGHQWWWEVNYPDAGVMGANEIHIPAGAPVRLELTSADVIHSFWAPGLQGKMDLVPGRVNTLWIEADEPGIHSAKCAEFCGLQHANMRLLVVAESEEGFADWLAARQAPAREPRTAGEREGQEVFLSSACVYCHAVEGTNASGRMGPDLTHIASRLTLGAGTLANNRGNLAGWIANSQAHKPGNRMPPMYLESEDLLALLDYLESLE